MIRWLYRMFRGGEHPDTAQARERLAVSAADDVRVDELAARASALADRTERILRENHLGREIMRALGVQR